MVITIAPIAVYGCDVEHISAEAPPRTAAGAQEALTDVFNASEQSLWLRAFTENRDEIEAAASDIDTGTSAESVRVTTAELSGPLA